MAEGGGYDSDACALDGEVVQRSFHPTGDERYDILAFLRACEAKCIDKIRQHIRRYGGARWYLCLNLRLSRRTDTGQMEYVTPYFRSVSVTSYSGDELYLAYTQAVMLILSRLDTYETQASGWNFDTCIKLDFIVISHMPLIPRGHIPLPGCISSKKAVLNIQNTDGMCFAWCILAFLHKHDITENRNRVNNYTRYLNEIQLTGLVMPLHVSKISQFERLNPTISVNVFALDTDDNGLSEAIVYPYRISKRIECQHNIDLLLLRDEEHEHYTLITSMSRLLGKQNYHQKFYCRRCLNGFARADVLETHTFYCDNHAPQRTRMPSPRESSLVYKHRGFNDKMNFVVYLDLECCLTPIHGCTQAPNTSCTRQVSRHIPTGYAYIIVSDIAGYTKPVHVYRGEDCIDDLLACLQRECCEISALLDCCVPVRLTDSDRIRHERATVCEMCNNPFIPGDPEYAKVLDHCHISGAFRSSLCNKCNLSRKISKYIDVIVHNGGGYDFNLILQRVGCLKDVNLVCVPGSGDSMRSFTLGRLRFIDSFLFLGASLDTLSRNLKTGITGGTECFKHLNSHFSPDQAHDLHQKMCFPYEFVTEFSVLNDTKQLPDRSCFYSALTNTNISQEDYMRAKRVWNSHDCQTLGDFQDVYVTTDVLLLADVFENFRSVSLERYGLDPAHYITIASFAYDACLKYTGICVDLITDSTMYGYVEASVRGGVAQVCSMRLATANNPYLPESYNPDVERSYIMYYDTNAMYACAMSMAVGHGGCRWLREDELDALDVMSIPDDSSDGYLIEIDMHSPQNMHKHHEQLPLGPTKRTVRQAELSQYARRVQERLGLHKSTQSKLLLTLEPKVRYTVHHKLLQTYIKHGMVVTRVHRGIVFWQDNYLKQFVDFNARLRASATNTFESNLCKLMVNSCYGKFLENVRERERVHLVTDTHSLNRLTTKPTFSRVKIYHNGLVGVYLKHTVVTLSKPIFIGVAILDLAKTVLYAFHYDHMMKVYGPRATLLYTDTDSLLYWIKTHDAYLDMLKSKSIFDLSSYPPTHFLYDVTNKKVPGKWSDETNGVAIYEFVGLKAKLYSLKLAGDNEQRVAKGVPRSQIREFLRHDMYKSCLTQTTLLRCENFHQIRADHHDVYTIVSTKLALSPYCDKRYLQADGVNSVPYGHYLIPTHM
jgi:hypothetical protein